MASTSIFISISCPPPLSYDCQEGPVSTVLVTSGDVDDLAESLSKSLSTFIRITCLSDDWPRSISLVVSIPATPCSYPHSAPPARSTSSELQRSRRCQLLARLAGPNAPPRCGEGAQGYYFGATGEARQSGCRAEVCYGRPREGLMTGLSMVPANFLTRSGRVWNRRVYYTSNRRRAPSNFQFTEGPWSNPAKTASRVIHYPQLSDALEHDNRRTEPADSLVFSLESVISEHSTHVSHTCVRTPTLITPPFRHSNVERRCRRASCPAARSLIGFEPSVAFVFLLRTRVQVLRSRTSEPPRRAGAALVLIILKRLP